MKKRIILLVCVWVILFSTLNITFAKTTNKAEMMPDEEVLELLALSQISYEIPSKSLFALSAYNNYELISGSSVRVVELVGNGEKSKITISPQDLPIAADQKFINHSLSYEISLYNSKGKLIGQENKAKKVSSFRTNFTSKGTVKERKYQNFKQLVVDFEDFDIIFPIANQKTKYYVVIRPSSNEYISEVKTENITINAPNDKDLDIIYDKIYQSVFGDRIIPFNTKVVSNEFLDNIHPGRMYTLKKNVIYWKKLIRNKLTEYIYIGNSEEADIVGSGFFAAAFKDDNSKRVVIAYRGTEGLGAGDDLLQDITFGVTSLLPQQFDLAREYYNLIKKEYSGYDVILTGHSLGGTLANSITLEDINEISAKAFDPVNGERITYSGGPISIGFNAATNYILENYSKKLLLAETLEIEGNFLNIVTNKDDFVNGIVVGGAVVNRILNSMRIANGVVARAAASRYANKNMQLREYTNNVSDVKGGVHGLASLVDYNGKNFLMAKKSQYILLQ